MCGRARVRGADAVSVFVADRVTHLQAPAALSYLRSSVRRLCRRRSCRPRSYHRRRTAERRPPVVPIQMTIVRRLAGDDGRQVTHRQWPRLTRQPLTIGTLALGKGATRSIDGRSRTTAARPQFRLRNAVSPVGSIS